MALMMILKSFMMGFLKILKYNFVVHYCIIFGCKLSINSDILVIIHFFTTFISSSNDCFGFFFKFAPL